MRLEILKIKLSFCLTILILLTSSCKKNSNLDNQITVKIKVIDSKTKKSRINKLDTIQIKMVKFGYLKKSFVKVGEYKTDTEGTVKIKLDSTEEYHISIYGTNVFGWANFDENVLNDGQEIILEASPPEKR